MKLVLMNQEKLYEIALRMYRALRSLQDMQIVEQMDIIEEALEDIEDG
ncbi:MAG: hypothetical protein ACWGQW_00515 [bacterium]